MARPSEYNEQIALEICKRVSEGEPIHGILDSKEEYPSKQTWYNWMVQNPQLLDTYHASRKQKADAKEKELESYKNDLTTGKLDPHAAKVLLDVTKWQMGVYNQKMYGNKADINIDDDTNGITINIHKKDS